MKKLISSMLCLSALTSMSAEVDRSSFFVQLDGAEQSIQFEDVQKSEHLFKNYYLITVDENNYDQVKAELKNNSHVLKVINNMKSSQKDLSYEELNFSLNIDVQKGPFNDPQVGRLWAFNDTNKSGINVNKAYINDLKMQRKPIIVAVADTGIDYNHEDLADNMWINEAEKNGTPGVDDDGNGYIDDIHGINFLKKLKNGEPSGDPMASHWHGTHVAGTIGAVQNNNIGIAGVAKNVKLMAIRVVPDRGDETDADVVKAFLYAAKNGAKVINCSFGKRVNEGGMVVSEAIDEIAAKYGTLVVAAAGNENANIDTSMRYPASFENDTLLVVSSLGGSHRYAGYSNYGKKNSDIAAPGGGQFWNQIYSTKNRNSYGGAAGTSMAAPHVAGVAAEVLSHFPTLSPMELKNILMSSIYDLKSKATQVDTLELERGKETVTNGLIDLHLALRNAKKFIEVKK